jgi:hypothetical protein
MVTAGNRVILEIPKMSGASEKALPVSEHHPKEEADDIFGRESLLPLGTSGIFFANITSLWPGLLHTFSE